MQNYPPKRNLNLISRSHSHPSAFEGMALNLSGSDLEDEELERQVQEMAKKILEYRATLPDQLKNTFASILAAHRPAFSDRSGPGTSGALSLDAGQVASNKVGLLADGDQTFEKMGLHKDKVPSSVAALHIVLKRAEECFFKIDKLDPQNRTSQNKGSS